MDSVDRKYAGILSTRLNQYTVLDTNPYSSNFRCYVCGDSNKSKTKKRGYLHEKSNKLFYYCHNCHYNKPLGIFLKYNMPALYNEYVVDQKLEKDIYETLPETPVLPLDKLTMRKPKFDKKDSPLNSIKKVSQLRPDHPAIKYVKDRGIPSHQHYRIYYAPKWKKWINSIVPDKLDNVEYDQPRLVFPLLDKDGNVNGANGRAFDPKALRYQTIMFNENAPKMFGLEKVDFLYRYYIVEGPIDSLFLDNSIAMVGADSNLKHLKNLDNAVFIHDLEPRNENILRKIEKHIDSDRKVCLIPHKYEKYGKDINDFVLGGISDGEIKRIVDDNTFSGLDAKIKFFEWKRMSL